MTYSQNEYDEEDSFLVSNISIINNTNHKNVLNATKSVSKSMLVQTCIGYFYDALVEGVWILYAQWIFQQYFSNDDANTNMSILVFSCNIMAIIGAIIFSYLGDRCGFDIVSLFTSTIITIGCALQCVYVNLALFLIGIALHSSVQDDIEIITLAFFGKYLPFEAAVTYTGYYYFYSNIFYLLGFICASFITNVASYRAVYLFVLCIMLIRWLYVVCVLRNKEKLLIPKQLQFIEQYSQILNSDTITNENNFEMNELEKQLFPICLDKLNEHNTDNQTFFDTNNIHTKSKWFWIELMLNIFQLIIIKNEYLQAITFHALYMNDRFNVRATISLLQIATIPVCDCVVSLLYDQLESLSINNKYLLLNICYIVFIPLLLILFPFTTISYIYLYWIYMIILGLVIALSCAITEILILELQPKLDSGKINGLKAVLEYLLSGGVMFLIVYSWNVGDNYLWYWYIRGTLIMMALCFSTFLCCSRIRKVMNHVSPQ
eukprot:56615_1